MCGVQHCAAAEALFVDRSGDVPVPISPDARWRLAGMIGLPVLALTGYLLWLWPRPQGTGFLPEVGPYLACLLLGLPFAVSLARGPGRALVLLAYVVGGVVILWVYALMVLCGVRGVCL